MNALRTWKAATQKDNDWDWQSFEGQSPIGTDRQRPGDLTSLRILKGECHVWWGRPTDASFHLTALLNEAELARWASFRNENQRALYLVAHALVRLALAPNLGVHPGDVPVAQQCPKCGGSHGKPRVDVGGTDLELSICHSGQCVGVALARGTRLGIDVEQARADGEASSIPCVLSPQEQAVLNDLPEEARYSAFLRYWTRKEAVLKATGCELRIELDQLMPSGLSRALELRGWAREQQPDARLMLYDLRPVPRHVASLAALGPPLKIIERNAAGLLRNRGTERGAAGGWQSNAAGLHPIG